MSKIYECDLHCHTTRSDGNVTPKELIDYAAKRGLKVIAITDHDVVPPEVVEVSGQDMTIEAYAAIKGIYVIKGIEISCDTHVEDVHIIALGCDWSHSFFKILEETAAKSKVESYRTLVEQLNKSGICIDWDELLYNEGSSILPEELQKKKIFEMIAKKGYVGTWQEAKLMVKRSKEYNVMREKPDPGWVIQEIHNAGGIAILAHPYLFTVPAIVKGRVLNRKGYIDWLIDMGLDGIEACYTYNKTSYDGDKARGTLAKDIKAAYASRLAVISGGSDYHGDEKKGVKNPRLLGECGFGFEEFQSNPVLKKLLD